ncbi:MAG: GH25 family lysozyme [Candidatus Obscuribacter sp.]|nr:GH25 family lysozyme [Candidatus Obscuribacter sp.]
MSAKFDKVLFLSFLSSVSLLLSVKQQAGAAVVLPDGEAPTSSRLQPPPVNSDPILSFAEPPSLDTGQSGNLVAPPPIVPMLVEQPVALSQDGSSLPSASDLPVVVVPRVPPGAQLGTPGEALPTPLPVPVLPPPPVSDQAVLPPPPDVLAVPAAPDVPVVTGVTDVPLAETTASAPTEVASAASGLPDELIGMVALAPLPPTLPPALVEPPPLPVRRSPFVATEPTALRQPPLNSPSPLPLPTPVAVDDSIVLLAPPPTSLQTSPLAAASNNSLPAGEPPVVAAPDVNSSAPVGTVPKGENPPAVAAVGQPVVPVQTPSLERDGKILTGVDVSGWQDEVDWQRLKDSGVDYAYLKSTEGRTFVDPTYAVNRQNARKAGVITGAYHFFRPATPVLDQVDNFMKVVGRVESDDLPPALDLEDPSLWRGYSHAEKLEMVLTWLQEVEKRTGVRPIIYASPSFVESVLGSAPELASYKLWLAHYTSADAPSLPQPFSDWLMWQYSDKGRLPGVVGNVDLNRFRGHPQDLLAQARGVAPSIPTENAPPVTDVAALPQNPPVTQPLSPPADSVDRVADVIINFELGAS